AVEWGEALAAVARATPAVAGAIGAGAVPRHANEQRPIVTEVRRPPALRVRHHRVQVTLERGEVEGLQLLRVVEAGPHRVRLRRALAQQIEAQLVRPPVAVRRSAACGVGKGALALVRHGLLLGFERVEHGPGVLIAPIHLSRKTDSKWLSVPSLPMASRFGSCST